KPHFTSVAAAQPSDDVTNVIGPGCLIEFLHQGEAFLALIFAIAEIDAALQAPEKIGDDHGKARGSEITRFAAHGFVHAEYLLQHHQAAARGARWRGEKGVDLFTRRAKRNAGPG